jgi:uncharacterized protein YjiS (DUF1127 family)
MAYLLSGERPAVAALSSNPLSTAWRWLRQARAAHAQRVALHSLLEFDAHLLEDLGISRQDVVEAITHPVAHGHALSAHRQRSAKAWFGPR